MTGWRLGAAAGEEREVERGYNLCRNVKCKMEKMGLILSAQKGMVPNSACEAA